MRHEAFPELQNHIGEDLIVTDGKTLLGADDKAGVAEIMNLLAYYTSHPELPHRTICVAFTPDEEIGAGVDHFNTELFGAREAYTVDGSKLGEIEYECFNAAYARVEITGRSTHTGDAKNAMLSAVLVGMEFNAMLPASERPEHTEGYEGFYHLDSMEGRVDHAVLKYIIRDHDYDKFQARKEFMTDAAKFINAKYKSFVGRDILKITLRDQYYNMAIPLRDHMHLITRAEEAMRKLGIEPITRPIRGGTDGARLTYMGIPCPNLCNGGYNFHGRFEYASVQEMEKSAELLILIAAV
jgi:tripeptide aminopeptidase